VFRHAIQVIRQSILVNLIENPANSGFGAWLLWAVDSVEHNGDDQSVQPELRAAPFLISQLVGCGPVTSHTISTCKDAEHWKPMKRDMNLIRELLLFYESDCTLPYPTADESAITQHMIWLIEADLIAVLLANSSASGNPQSFIPIDGRIMEKNGRQCMHFPLTWNGCEFLAAARDNHRWHKSMQIVGGFPFALINEYLKASIKNSIPGLRGFISKT